MIKSAELYELLFGEPSTEERLEAMRRDRSTRYRVKTRKCGDLLECEIFPIRVRMPDATRARKAAKTKDAQRKVNERNAERRFLRLLHTNFTRADCWYTLTYDGPAPDIEQAKRDIANFIKRFRNYCRKKGYPELKYIYVTELATDPSYEMRAHHHIIMNTDDYAGVMQVWGNRNIDYDHLKPDEHSMEALAAYLVKTPNGKKRWCASRNLKKPPRATRNDRKISKRKMRKLALAVQPDAAEIFEGLYEGYRLGTYEVRFSDYTGGAFLYARLWRKDSGWRDYRGR